MSKDIIETNTDYIRKQETNQHSYENMAAIIDAMPLCVNLWNIKTENTMCNRMAMELFGLTSKEQYLAEFFNLSPERQPDGRLSSEAAFSYVNQAREEGFVVFNWLHCKLDGEEIPSEVTLRLLPILDENNEPLVAGFTRDLRSKLIDSTEATLDDFYFNQISDKIFFSALTDFSEECFFVYNVEASSVQFFGKGREILGLSSEKLYRSDLVSVKNRIFQEDRSIFAQMINAIRHGQKRPCDLRIVMPDDSVRYYKIVYKIIKDALGVAKFAIGKTYDIHERKSLEVLSQTDLLTGCYNKITTENFIAKGIEEQKNATHTLFIVDIDNFKAINDNLGHHFGDLVLRDVANKLRTNFRDLDIVGRIGGDEFIVFLQDTQQLEVIEAKAKAISEAFQNSYSGENHDYKISGSIGIALYPKDGKNYEELYKAADKALYQSKLAGKDRYTFYSDKLIDGTMKNLTILENASRLANSYFDAELVSTVFDLMYETVDVSFSLNAVLQIIGQRLKVDRCYLYETFDQGLSYNMTYEWCKEGISKEIDNLQNLQVDSNSDVFKPLAENNALYCNDSKMIEDKNASKMFKGQGIQSFLLVQTRGKEYARLIIGLDDCTQPRLWKEKEINSITYALKMLSIFMYSDSLNKANS